MKKFWRMQLHPADPSESTKCCVESLAAGFIGLAACGKSRNFVRLRDRREKLGEDSEKIFQLTRKDGKKAAQCGPEPPGRSSAEQISHDQAQIESRRS